jgi:hypothetical protein
MKLKILKFQIAAYTSSIKILSNLKKASRATNNVSTAK